MPRRPAIASRCTTALVEPPSAARATIALRNEAADRTWLGRRPSWAISTASTPVPCAWASSRLSGAGRPAVPGSVIPSTSASSPIVEAVPMVLQCPRLRIIDDSDWRNSCSESLPARTSSLSRHTSVPQPSGIPRNVPVSIGPPGTTTAGRSTDAAPISRAGIVLSHPPSSTTPSIGLARIISSIAMAAMFRHSIAVGRTCVSPSDTTGMSSGTPPASQMPAATCSATSVRCRLHGTRSEAVFAIAICGRPVKAESGAPRRIHARWMYAFRPCPPYHWALRRSDMVSCSRYLDLIFGTPWTLPSPPSRLPPGPAGSRHARVRRHRAGPGCGPRYRPALTGSGAGGRGRRAGRCLRHGHGVL